MSDNFRNMSLTQQQNAVRKVGQEQLNEIFKQAFGQDNVNQAPLIQVHVNHNHHFSFDFQFLIAEYHLEFNKENSQTILQSKSLEQAKLRLIAGLVCDMYGAMLNEFDNAMHMTQKQLPQNAQMIMWGLYTAYFKAMYDWLTIKHEGFIEPQLIKQRSDPKNPNIADMQTIMFDSQQFDVIKSSLTSGDLKLNARAMTNVQADPDNDRVTKDVLAAMQQINGLFLINLYFLIARTYVGGLPGKFISDDGLGYLLQVIYSSRVAAVKLDFKLYEQQVQAEMTEKNDRNEDNNK